MELRYDISAVGQNQVRAVIRGIEQELLASNRRMTNAIRGGAGVARPKQLTAGAAISAATAETRAITRVRLSEEDKVWREKERQAKRFAQIEIQEVRKVLAERGKTIRAMGTGIGKSVTGSVGGMARYAAGGASLAGGIAIASALHDQMKVQAYASRVANQGERPDLKGQLATQAQTLKGFTGEEALSALDQFVQKSGDLKGGIDAWQMMGQVSLATSSDITEVGEASGSAFNLISEQTKDPIKRLEMLRDVMETLAVQGNKGSIEMRNFATVLPSLAAAARQFGGDRGENLKKVGALAQLSVKRGGATNAEEAATSINRFVDDLITDSKLGKKHGALDIFTDKSHTKIKDVGTIIGEVMDATGGDLGKIQGYFGVRGRRAFSGVSPAYLDAFNAAEKVKPGSGKAAGRAAVIASIGEFTGASAGKGGMEARANMRLEDLDLRIEEAVKAFNVAIGTQLLPVVTKLIPEFTALVPTAAMLTEKLVTFVEFLENNPVAGIGALIAGKITSDLASAAIGAGAKKAFESSIGSAGGIVIGSLLMGIETASVLIANADMKANQQFDEAKRQHAAVLAQANKEVEETGNVTPETLAKVRALKQFDEKTIAEQNADHTGIARKMLNTFTFGATGESELSEKGSLNRVTGTRLAEVGQEKNQAEGILAFAESAKKLSGAADKLIAAGGALAMNDPNRTKPIVAR